MASDDDSRAAGETGGAHRRVRRSAVRAMSVHDILAHLDKWEPGTFERVRALIPDDVFEVIESTPRRGWIDVEDDIYVPTSIFEVLGDEDATQFMREFLLGHFDNPILRPIVQSTRRLFGLVPVSALRILPSGWPLVYRDVCRISVDSMGECSGQLVFSDVAPTVIQSPGYFASFRAILLGVIDLTGHEGEVILRERNVETCSAIFHFSWRDKS